MKNEINTILLDRLEGGWINKEPSTADQILTLIKTKISEIHLEPVSWISREQQQIQDDLFENTKNVIIEKLCS